MPRPVWSAVAAMLALVVAPCTAGAQQPCSTPEHRQFDFWAGTWEVTAKERVAGRNEITVEEGGCVLHEHWTGAGGSTGQSFNVYDAGAALWHQFWVDNSGTVLHLTGRFESGAMRLAGATVGRDGGTVRQRLTFTPNPDGTVRQLWEQSPDGATWSPVFDGLYRRK